MSTKNVKASTPRSQSNQRTYESYIRNMASSRNMGESTTNTSHPSMPPAPPSIGVGQTPPSTAVSKPPTAGGFTLEADALALGNPVQGDTISFTVESVDQGVAVLGTPVLLKNKVPPTL